VCVSYQSSPCAESLAHSPESQEIVVGEIHAYNRVTQCGCCKSRAAGSGNSRTNELINLPFSRKKPSLPAGSGLAWPGPPPVVD
jgi:ribosomal protein L34E